MAAPPHTHVYRLPKIRGSSYRYQFKDSTSRLPAEHHQISQCALAGWWAVCFGTYAQDGALNYDDWYITDWALGTYM